MLYIFILLFIPIFFVGLVIYISTLFEYMLNGNMDTVLLLIGVFASVLSCYIVLKLIGLIDKDDIKLLKFQKRIDSYAGLISFSLLFLFGLSLGLNSLFNEFNLANILGAIFIISMYFYIVYYYFIQSKIYIFKVEDIYKINDKLYVANLSNKEVGSIEIYLTDKSLKKNKTYKCSYNKGSHIINKISNEVIEVE